VTKFRASWFVVGAVALASCVVPQAQYGRNPRFGRLLQLGERPLRVEADVQVFDEQNGLTVALLRDTRTNLVSVDVRYLVGAAEDPAGRAGLAHLVEHLTFLAHVDGSGETIGDRMGDAALSYNAYTEPDDTHYTSTALSEHVGELLAIEARRMHISCDQIDETLFSREKDVVIAEEVQRAGKYQALRTAITSDLWGDRHPYTRATMTGEVGTASREDACAFLAHHYGPSRAILVVTGNFEIGDVRAAIAREFGGINDHVTGKRVGIAPARLNGSSSTYTADVDEATAVVWFAAPSWGGVDANTNKMVRDMLRVQLRQLDDAEEWITGSGIVFSGDGAARLFGASLSVADPNRLDAAVAKIEAAAKETPRELVDHFEMLRSQLRTDFASDIDGFDGTGNWLATFLQYTDNRRFYAADLDEIAAIGAEDAAAYARNTLRVDRSYAIRVRPSGKKAKARRADLEGGRREHDVQPWRAPVDAAEAMKPLTVTATRVVADVRDFRLANGLRVLLAPDPGSLMIDARLVFPIGAAADPADQRGLAQLAAVILDHDGQRKYAYEDVRRLDWAMRVGTQLDNDVDERATTFRARGASMYADWHVWRLFWLLDAGIFAREDLSKLEHRFAARERLRDTTDPAALRGTALRQKLFGTSHPYAAQPIDAAQLARIGIADLETFRDASYRAQGATLIVAGGFDPGEMRAEIEELYGAWSGDAPMTVPQFPAAQPAAGPSWVAVDDPDAAQVSMTIAFGTLSDPEKDRAARYVLEAMLEDRVRVVREGLAASYSVSVGYASGLGGGVLSVDGEVEPDRAGRALSALAAELVSVHDNADKMAEDFVRARRRALARVLADSSGASDLGDELAFIAERGLPLSFFSDLARDVGAVTLADVVALAAKDLRDQRKVVALSGPKKAVEAAFQAVGAKPQWLSAPR
jgi:zinc protease